MSKAQGEPVAWVIESQLKEVKRYGTNYISVTLFSAERDYLMPLYADPPDQSARIAEIEQLKTQRDELLEALELLIDDLALRAKLRGDDCLDVSDGRLIKAQEAITKAKGTYE